MKHEDLPERWANKLREYLRDELRSERDTLSAADFNQQSIRINFEDGSSAFFNYAFYLLDRDLNEIAIFTEHCGYHVFSLGGTNFQLFQPKWIEDGTESD